MDFKEIVKSAIKKTTQGTELNKAIAECIPKKVTEEQIKRIVELTNVTLFKALYGSTEDKKFSFNLADFNKVKGLLGKGNIKTAEEKKVDGELQKLFDSIKTSGVLAALDRDFGFDFGVEGEYSFSEFKQASTINKAVVKLSGEVADKIDETKADLKEVEKVLKEKISNLIMPESLTQVIQGVGQSFNPAGKNFDAKEQMKKLLSQTASNFEYPLDSPLTKRGGI